ncbi:MAG: hypothetical protein WKF58_15600 [Ilumatobacteraceae bacterium]
MLAGDVVEVEQRLHPAHRAGERHDVHTEAQQLIGDVDVLARVCEHDGGARREVGDIGHDACVAQHPCRCLRRLVAAIVEHQPVTSVEQPSAASAHDTHADDADRGADLRSPALIAQSSRSKREPTSTGVHPPCSGGVPPRPRTRSPAATMPAIESAPRARRSSFTWG